MDMRLIDTKALKINFQGSWEPTNKKQIYNRPKANMMLMENFRHFVLPAKY